MGHSSVTKGRAALRAALTVCAWLALMTLPTRNVTPETEPSWGAVLNYAAVHHLQFGVDIIYNYGPFGFLALHSYAPATWFWIVLFQAASRAVYLLLLNEIPLPRGTSRITLLLVAIVFPLFSPDVFDFLFITFVGVLFCEPDRHERLFIKWSALAFVAAIALIKFTFFAYALFMLVCICISLASSRRIFEALRVFGIWCICLAGFWLLLARQQLANFPKWVRGSYEITQAYQLSLSIQPSKNVLWYGILLLSFMFGALFWALRARPRNFPVILLIAAGIFLAWKQGFTRCDADHFPAFFLYSGVIIVALPLVLGLERWKWTLLISCVCLGWGSMGNSKFPIPHLFENAEFLSSRHQQRNAEARLSELYDLPNIRSKLQTSTVDVVGTAQGIAIINHFNYRPAPIFQMFSAGNSWLAEANADYYCSAAAPEYVIYKPRAVDDRLETLDLSLVGLILSTRYEHVTEEKGYTLLHRKSAASSLPQLELTDCKVVKPGQEISVEQATWCKIDMEETAMERLLRLLYQSSRIRISVRTADAVYTKRFIPSMGRTGFLIPENALTLAIEDSHATRASYRPSITFRLYRTEEVLSRLPGEDSQSSTQPEMRQRTGARPRSSL